MERHENLVLVGPPGVGRPHLAVALGHKAVERGYRVLFLTVDRLVNNLYVVTSDVPFRERGHIFDSPTLAAAALDRLLHHAHIFSLRGENSRLRRETDPDLTQPT